MPDFKTAGFIRAVGGIVFGDTAVVAGGSDPGGAAPLRSSGASAVMGHGAFGANAVSNPDGLARMVQVIAAGNGAFSALDTAAAPQQWDFGVIAKKFEIKDVTNNVHAMQITPVTGAVAFGGTLSAPSVVAPSVNASTSLTTPGIGLGGAAIAGVGLSIASAAFASAVQVGAQVRPVFTSAALTTGRSIDIQFQTATATFTMPIGTALHINTPSLGAGTTVTTLYGIFIENQTGGGTNYALYTNGGLIRFGGLGGGTGVLSAGATDSGGSGFKLLRVPN